MPRSSRHSESNRFSGNGPLDSSSNASSSLSLHRLSVLMFMLILFFYVYNSPTTKFKLSIVRTVAMLKSMLAMFNVQCSMLAMLILFVLRASSIPTTHDRIQISATTNDKHHRTKTDRSRTKTDRKPQSEIFMMIGIFPERLARTGTDRHVGFL
eukprot:scaffold16717_cov53-Attheya_sp.AAC.11